jgi:hypothetical protein
VNSKCGDAVHASCRRRSSLHARDNGQHCLFSSHFAHALSLQFTGANTRAVLVTSSDPCGVKMIITTATQGENSQTEVLEDPDGTEPYGHFRASFVKQFFDSHNDRQSIGVLGFEVSCGELHVILERYKKLHPSLLISDDIATYTDTRVIRRGANQSSTIEMGRMSLLEVYAYYKPGSLLSEADTGTVLRFVERQGSFASSPGFSNPEGVLPGLCDTDPHFDGTSIPAYSDHWVSNVIDREGFLSTLQDTLGFIPKVEFNAGVIAAGAARIESTVIGNSSTEPVTSEVEVLKSQSQVYLPINNALSKHGHVHTFLDQFGQGVQHLASRVQDLIAFVERVNNYRRMTGRGLSFLSIPRSCKRIFICGSVVCMHFFLQLNSCALAQTTASSRSLNSLKRAMVHAYILLSHLPLPLPHSRPSKIAKWCPQLAW